MYKYEFLLSIQERSGAWKALHIDFLFGSRHVYHYLRFPSKTWASVQNGGGDCGYGHWRFCVYICSLISIYHIVKLLHEICWVLVIWE